MTRAARPRVREHEHRLHARLNLEDARPQPPHEVGERLAAAHAGPRRAGAAGHAHRGQVAREQPAGGRGEDPRAQPGGQSAYAAKYRGQVAHREPTRCGALARRVAPCAPSVSWRYFTNNEPFRDVKV